MSTIKQRARQGRRATEEQPVSLPSAGTDRQVRLFAAVAVFAAAFLERWWFSAAWHEAGSLTSAFYYGDAQRLVENAMAIVQGRTFDNGIPYHPPGWPLLLAGLFKLLGAGGSGSFVVPVAAVKALLAALSAGAAAMAALIAYEVSGLPAMLIVALLGPFHFGHIVEGTVADTEALYGLLVTVAVFATLRAIGGARGSPVRDARSRSGAGRSSSARSSARPTPADQAASRQQGGVAPASLAWTAVAGAAGGYAMIVRAEFIACALILAAGIVWSRVADRRTSAGWPAYAAVFASLFVLVLAPTTVSHWRSIGAFNAAHVGRVAGPLPRFAPVTSYGPFNFAMANHENADGGPNRDHPMLDLCNAETSGRLDAGQLDLACPAVYDLYVHGYRIGLGWMLSHPGDAWTLIAHKLAMASGFLAHGYLADDVGAGVTGTRRRVDLVDPDSRLLLPVHLALLLGGFWVLRRTPLVAVVLAAPLVAFLASTVLFYGYVRLGTSYLPVVWVLQGSAVAALLPSTVRSPVKAAAIAGIAMAVLLTIDGLRIAAPRRLSLDGPRTDEGVLVQDETLRITRVED